MDLDCPDTAKNLPMTHAVSMTAIKLKKFIDLRLYGMLGFSNPIF